MKNKAFISWINLATSESTFLYEFPGKLAALWYDEIILQINSDTLHYARDVFADKERWGKDTLKELNKIHVPITEYTNGDSFYKPLENSKLLDPGVEIAKIYYEEKNPEEAFDSNNPHHLHSAVRTGGALATSFEAWEKLNKKINCSFLPNYYEGLFLESVQPKEPEHTSEILSIALPDLKDYSWDKIMDLRNNTFFDNFRDKISIFNESTNKGDIQLSKEIFEEIKNKDMIEMLQIMRPSPNTKIIKGIASNIPSPIGINPVSVYTAIEDVRKDLEVKNKFGWVYFLLDTRKN